MPNTERFGMSAETVTPKVSIVVRTHARPAVLREALLSLKAQTYSNFEVVVVEDGPSTALGVVESFKEYLDLRYFSTERHVGRSAAGNVGLSQARGEWLGFLDDDDQLLSQHIELLMKAAVHSDAKVVYGVAREVPTRVLRLDNDEFVYRESPPLIRYRQPFSRMLLWQKNYLSIQSVLFHRSLYEQYGGLDESLDQLEDWLLWVKYSLSANFLMVDAITSFYRVPADPIEIAKRQQRLAQAYGAAVSRQRAMQVGLSPLEVRELFEREFLRAPLRYMLRGRLRNWLYRVPCMHSLIRRFSNVIAKVRTR
jgi:glycosyltransferase involved in cell wall biosynthesis